MSEIEVTEFTNLQEILLKAGITEIKITFDYQLANESTTAYLIMPVKQYLLFKKEGK
jgi:hypothetical protein